MQANFSKPGEEFSEVITSDLIARLTFSSSSGALESVSSIANSGSVALTSSKDSKQLVKIINNAEQRCSLLSMKIINHHLGLCMNN